MFSATINYLNKQLSHNKMEEVTEKLVESNKKKKQKDFLLYLDAKSILEQREKEKKEVDNNG